MATTIVAARIDEYGRAHGGKSGDQTAREVCRQTLSGSGTWSKVFRPPRDGSKMASNALAIASNDNIGYDQDNRLSLDKAAAANGYNYAAVGLCECDCSSLVASVCRSCGFDVPASMWTGSEAESLVAAGFSELGYSASSLRVGDVLWRKGHTAIVVSTTNASPAPTPSGNASIKAVQSWLNSFVGAGLAVDGVRGPLTKRALVKAWQKVVGTAQDCIWGPKTRAATPVIKRGARGNAVKVLQGALICLGYDTGGFDGIFGGKTDSAVRAFQRAHGLSVDGQAGKNTFAALLTC